LKRILVAALVLFIAGALLGACLADGRSHSAARISGVSADPAVAMVLGRSCADCHSDNTAWPWYSRIPPVGEALRRDVSRGRAGMDFSRWAQYGPEQKDEALAEIAALVRNGQMPPGRYTLLHPSARLSDADVRRITEWTRQERRRIRAQAVSD
jgi:hypothetical protein